MFKELKYFFFISVIFLFIFLTLKYYFSDLNKKNSYRSLKSINSKIISYSQNLILLSNNTNNVVEYAEQTINNNKKNFNFWNLKKNND